MQAGGALKGAPAARPQNLHACGPPTPGGAPCMRSAAPALRLAPPRGGNGRPLWVATIARSRRVCPSPPTTAPRDRVVDVNASHVPDSCGKKKPSRHRTPRQAADRWGWGVGGLQRRGFLGILLLSAWPNAAFDLCGICCGHYQMPFWHFFGATFIGKALIKVPAPRSPPPLPPGLTDHCTTAATAAAVFPREAQFSHGCRSDEVCPTSWWPAHTLSSAAPSMACQVLLGAWPPGCLPTPPSLLA